MNKKRLIALFIIIVGVWYFWGRSQKADGPAEEGAKVEGSMASGEGHNPSQPPLTLRGGENALRVHYFTKEALASCSTETATLEQAVDPKYGHRAAGALVAMTLALPTEARETYASALVPGTRLLSLRMSDAGVATADYNSALDEAAAPCIKAERRAQIERTLRELPEIKDVVITVEGEVWAQ